jgi:hypothetical protein
MKNIHLIPTDKPSRLHLGNSGLVLCDLNFGKNTINGQHIYITSDEEIKEGDWVLGDFPDKPIGKVISKYGEEFTAQSLNGDKYGLAQYDSKKIILTTDQDLIKDGVQAIDDEFLEWFVKNPSCEEVEVAKGKMKLNDDGQEYGFPDMSKYKIIIPKEEPKQIKCYCGHTSYCDCSPLEESKQETLEEVAENYADKQSDISMRQNPLEYSKSGEELWYESKVDFIEGAKWQQERMYSEEEAIEFFIEGYRQRAIASNLIFDNASKMYAISLFEQFKKK